MSSRYTRVSCEEFDRVHRLISETQAYVVQSEQERERLEQLAEERLANLRRIQEETERAVASATDFLAERFSNRLRGSRGVLENEIQAQTGRLHEDLESLRTAASRTDFRISSVNTQIREIAVRFDEAFQNAIGQNTGVQSRAEYTATELDSLLERIGGLRPQQFEPTAYASLQSMRAAVSANLQNGDYQAAIQVSQGCILDAGTLLTRLIVINEQFDARVAELQEGLTGLQSQIDSFASSEGRIVIDVDGEEQQFEYDIDYWSEGLFGTIREQTETMGTRLQQLAQNGGDIQALDTLGQEIDRVRSGLEQCDAEARRNLAGAVSVETLAQRLHEGLTGRGWELEDAGRREHDNRKPYTMTYDDGHGNRVSFVVASGETPEQPHFFYEAFSVDERREAIIKDGVGATLQSEGLVTGETVERDDCHENQDADAFVENVSNEAEALRLRRQQSAARTLRYT